MTDDIRATARSLAADAVGRGEPLAWFEELYAKAGTGDAVVPWADLAPNPHLKDLTGGIERAKTAYKMPPTALVVGCGLGDDAEWLAEQGWDVTAFDISPTAVERAKARFPASPVRYVAADLLDGHGPLVPADLVVEIYTVQVLSGGLRAAAIERLAALVAPGGRLLIVARLRDEADSPGTMPWPLTASELAPLDRHLERVRWDDIDDPYDPGVRRLRAIYERVVR